jgi:type II secretory pathway pseudopilin PulG
MKSGIITHSNPTEVDSLDALLDEINKQRKIQLDLQSDIRELRQRENKNHKTAEALKTENRHLRSVIISLEQKIREMEIQLDMPENERTYTTNRVIEVLPKKTVWQKINWAYVIMPILLVGGIVGSRWFIQHRQDQAAASLLAVQQAAQQEAERRANDPSIAPPIEEGYLSIHNPLDFLEPVRIRDSYSQNAREVAFVEPLGKYRIRATSPTKQTRTVLYKGKTLEVEDYFYKISDKNQWVFGFFTNRRTFQLQ